MAVPRNKEPSSHPELSFSQGAEQPSHTMLSGTEPSAMTIRHESELSSLKTSFGSMAEDLADQRDALQKLESAVRDITASVGKELRDVTASVSKEIRGFNDRMTQKNPMVYLGIGSLCLSLIVVASTLAFFVINAQIKPLQEHVNNHGISLEKAAIQERATFEKLIRLEERFGAIRHDYDNSRSAPTP